MDIYHYNREDGRYTGKGEADPDPMTPGEWLLPAFCTPLVPPFAGPDQITRFDGSQWVVEDKPVPPAPEPPPPPTPAQVRVQRAAAVQLHMDAIAMTYGYDSIASAVTYADEPAVPRFQAEGQAFRRWRSLVWAACYQVLAEVEAGNRAVPTESELLALLPALEVVYP